MSGPLTGYTIVELQGIGPGPFCGMLLSDMGADVIRIDRSANVRDGEPNQPSSDLLARGRKSIAVDLKSPEGVETVLRIIEQADGLIEGFRPGVMERLGLGPDICLERNPRLVYGRMTGWGQEGPYSQAAGHDINYIALAGCLAHIGRPGQAPVPPLNLGGDFGGGGMLLVVGVLCGLLETQRSGRGQVVDAAMVDGAAMLMTGFHAAMAAGALRERGTNRLDGGAHFYDVYECADGEYISIGSIEPQFYSELRRLAGLDSAEWDPQGNRKVWPELKEKIAKVFLSKTRDEWCEIMDGTDVCFAPVLTIPEAYEHPHNVARQTFVEVGGFRQPAPAPRFSRTVPEIAGPPTRPGEHTDEVLGRFGFGPADIKQLRDSGAVR
ncbi:MAG: alpha-methylacyl-CoA racemase [Acidimicrobiia bacterium]|nr:alpha-methylacyl-CoA racemase [Acidimicrobiia bacterium]